MGIAELAGQGFQYFINKSFDELPLSFLVWSSRFLLDAICGLGYAATEDNILSVLHGVTAFLVAMRIPD